MTLRLIGFTLVALSLVNAYSFAKLYSTTYVSDASLTKKAPRMPAAITPEMKAPAADLNTRLALDLNCDLNHKLAGLKVTGQWAQLKGRVCENKKLKLVEITNLNNGFTASVFEVGTQNYQTDLIQLVLGTNKIRVKITLEKGSVVEQTVIIDSQPI